MNITEETFENFFTIQPNHIIGEAPFGGMYETYGEELEYIVQVNNKSPERVWTILDVDGEFYITTGYHHVNRFGYLITNEPFEQEYTVKVETE